MTDLAPAPQNPALSPDAGWGISQSVPGAGITVSANPPDLPNALVVSSTIVDNAAGHVMRA